MELKEAKNILEERKSLLINSSMPDISLITAIDTVLEELDNRISKDELKNVLRRVQDYQLNYKDTVLFNIIMQEIFGETEWTNLEDKE